MLLAVTLCSSGCYGSTDDGSGAGAGATASGSGDLEESSESAGSGGRDPSTDPPPEAPSAPAPSTGGSAAGGSPTDPPPAVEPTVSVFDGEPCTMGDEAECTCINGGDGTRVCLFDAESPTGGRFSDCTRCAAPAVDAGTGSLCFEATWRFGYQGGFVAVQDDYALSPCAEFSIRRTDFGDLNASRMCGNRVPDAAEINAAVLAEVLSWTDVAEAFASSPAFYGLDGRPFDAPIFRIDRAGQVVELGLDCGVGADPSCSPIPSGLSELREVLLQLVEQQRNLPDCNELP